jgi:type I restriction enzyme S subunit
MNKKSPSPRAKAPERAAVKVIEASIAAEDAALELKAPVALVPKLRFPEFREQTIRSLYLGEVTEECTKRRGKNGIQIPIKGVSKFDGIVPMEERLIGKDIARYKLVMPGCFAYNPMRINIGSIARWNGDGEVLVSPDYIVFRCLNINGFGISADYLDQFRASIQWERFLTGNGDGGVRIRIYYKDLAQLPMCLPQLSEQQRIADCLTSLDELIAAQGRKLDALKTHKSGLMQQLFPREGETVPSLRFPEFQDAGEWEVKKLCALVELVSGVHLSPEQYGKEGKVPYFTGPSDFTNTLRSITKRTNNSLSLAKHDDTLITVKGSGVGEIFYLTLSCVAIGRQLMAVRAVDASSRFIFQLLLTKRRRFADFAAGNLIPGLSRGDILDLEASFPSISEQQRIAECLSSLDELVAAEAEKMEALKMHKKGLMQQLFPTMEESL